MKEIDESPPEPGQKNSDIIHYHKINIFGESGVGKSSLISHMENYDNDNFNIKDNDLSKTNLSLNSINAQSLIEQIKRVKIPINDKYDLFLNLYETNLDNYDDIKINLDTLLLQTECIIIMWDCSKYETFDNIPNFYSVIIEGMKDNKFRKAPIFIIENKKDLNDNQSQDKLEKNKIKDSIEKLKKENNNIIFKEISLLEKDDFMELVLDIYRNLINQKEKNINNNDVVDLVKFKEKSIILSNNNKNDYILIKCNFLGSSNTGKTTFIKYIQGEVNKNCVPTVGIESIFIQANINKENVYVQITDTCGQERYRSIAKSQLNNVDIILLFYDITNKESFEDLDYWFESIDNSIDLKDIPLIIVANKIDENEKRVVNKKKGLEIAKEKGFKYYECSSINGLNVLEISNELILDGYYKKCEKKNKKRDILNQSLESTSSQINKNYNIMNNNDINENDNNINININNNNTNENDKNKEGKKYGCGCGG